MKFYQYFQYLSFLIAIFCYKGLKFFNISFIIIFLLISCTTETIATLYKFFGWKSNYLPYNIYLFASSLVVFILFDRMLSLKMLSRQVFWGIASLCLLFITLNLFFLQGFNNFNTYSLIIIEILNIFFCCLILLQLAKSDKIIIFLHDPYFLISASLLLFSLGTLVVLGLQDFILKNKLKLLQINLYRVIMPPLNIILYSTFSVAFILCRKHAQL